MKATISAIHEVGHVLLALAVGARVSEVTVAPEAFCSTLTPSAWPKTAEIERRRLRIEIAGIVAEVINFGWVDIERCRARAARIVELGDGASVPEVLAEEAARVAHHLAAHSDTLQALADALTAKGRLSEEEIVAIVGQTPDTNPIRVAVGSEAAIIEEMIG